MKDVVFYDADCAFCKWTTRMIRKLDWCKNVSFMALQDYRGSYFSEQELKKSLHLVSGKGKSLQAFQAMRCILARLPLTKLISPVLYLPGMHFLGNRLYFWIAKNRGEIFHLLKKMHLAKTATV